MFFYLSKILSFAITPLFWIIALIVVAVAFKPPGIRRVSLVLSLIITLFFSNQLVYRLAVDMLEVPIVKESDITMDIETAVVLGGTASWHIPSERVRFSGAADRLWQGIALLKHQEIKKIVFTGGTADLLQEKRREAEYVAEYVQMLGVADSLFLTENSSRNTHENALMCAQMFDSLGMDKEIILITSAFHMKRARGCFEKAGFRVIAYPCDPLTNGDRPKFDEFIVPSAEALSGWNIILREWIGYLTYKFKGFV